MLIIIEGERREKQDKDAGAIEGVGEAKRRLRGYEESNRVAEGSKPGLGGAIEAVEVGGDRGEAADGRVHLRRSHKVYPCWKHSSFYGPGGRGGPADSHAPTRDLRGGGGGRGNQTKNTTGTSGSGGRSNTRECESLISRPIIYIAMLFRSKFKQFRVFNGVVAEKKSHHGGGGGARVGYTQTHIQGKRPTKKIHGNKHRQWGIYSICCTISIRYILYSL